MTAVEIAGEAGSTTLELHDAVTVVAVDERRRGDIARALAASIDAAVVAAAGAARPDPDVHDDASASAAVAVAEAAVADARAALDQAERAYRDAQEAVAAADPQADDDAASAVRAAEAQLEAAQDRAAAARRALVEAREAGEQDDAQRRVRAEEDGRRLEELREERRTLEDRRAQLLGQLRELGAAPDPAPVEEALSGLQRLRSVEPKPSEQAAALADRWAAVQARLAELPVPPAPPEWLVTPALAALQDAREALARVESASVTPPDAGKVAAVERAHREVLEAEQRVMRKGSRLNRRRLEQAQEAERKALDALGATSYGDYLQRIAPDTPGATEERLAQARAALADAEAVWEELHGGATSPEYTAAKEEQAEIRAAAMALLGEEVDDFDLENRLRAHVETVVDTEWAVERLSEALVASGADPGSDPAAAAEAWLAELPERLAARRALDDELAATDRRLKEIDEVLTTQDVGGPAGETATDAPSDAVTELTRALEDAEAAEREAEDALAAARATLDEEAAARADARDRDADAARAEVDRARERLAEAEAALGAARDASAEAATAASEAKAATSSTAAGIAEEVWLLARLAAARARPSTTVVVDARAALAPRALRLLERAAAGGRVVVLGDEEIVAEWAKGLGDRAAIRTI